MSSLRGAQRGSNPASAGSPRPVRRSPRRRPEKRRPDPADPVYPRPSLLPPSPPFSVTHATRDGRPDPLLFRLLLPLFLPAVYPDPPDPDHLGPRGPMGP